MAYPLESTCIEENKMHGLARSCGRVAASLHADGTVRISDTQPTASGPIAALRSLTAGAAFRKTGGFQSDAPHRCLRSATSAGGRGETLHTLGSDTRQGMGYGRGFDWHCCLGKNCINMRWSASLTCPATGSWSRRTQDASAMCIC